MEGKLNVTNCNYKQACLLANGVNSVGLLLYIHHDDCLLNAFTLESRAG